MNRFNLRRLGAILALVALTALPLAACGDSDDGNDDASASDSKVDTSKPFVVGAALGVTGDCAQGDATALDGIKYEVDKVNADGGLNGQKIKLISKDMQSKPALAGRVTQELIDQGAQVILGPCLAGNAIPTAQAAAAKGIPTILVTNTVPLPDEVMKSHLVFFAGFSDNVQAAAAAEYALKQGYETAALLSSKDISYTSDTPKWFGEAFEHGGGRVVDTINYSILKNDYSAQATEAANIDPKPDVVYGALFQPDLGIFVPQLRKAGVESALIGADAWEDQGFAKTNAEIAEGIVLSTHGLNQPGTPFASVIEGITKTTGKTPEADGYAVLGADAITLIQKAAEEAGSNDPKAIADAIFTFENVELNSGPRTYAGTDGAPKLPITMARIHDGKYELEEEIEPSFVPTP
jgi:branched-chain amino acid transport system substrate-binding protein